MAAVAVVCLGAISAELGIRARLFFKDPHRWDERGLFRYRPDCQVGDSPDLTTNNHGFFGPDLAVPKPADACRVLLVGSSPLVTPEIPRVVQETLNARLPGRVVQVNTTGLPRYTSYHNALLFEHYLVDLEPDCVVLYLGLNDNVYNTNPGLEGEPPTGLWNWADPSSSLVLDMLGYHAIHKRFRVRPDFEAIRSAAILENHLRRIIELAETRGIRIVLVKMAVGYPSDDPELVSVIRDAERPMRHFWGDLEPCLRALEAHNALFERLAAEFRLPLVDAQSALPPTSEVFWDLCHFTPGGNERFASFVADRVGDVLTKKEGQ